MEKLIDIMEEDDDVQNSLHSWHKQTDSLLCGETTDRPFKSLTTKKTNPFGLVFFVVGEDGFEPSKRNAADLQSVPFGHSGTPPYSILSDWSR